MSAGKPWIGLFIATVWIKMAPSLGRRFVKKIRGQKPDRFDNSVPRKIPRTIWMYWDGGENAAPELVRICIASWRDKNPGWTLHVLDRSSVDDVTTVPHSPADIPVQSFADLLRLRLLNEQGGVWADATTYCMKPLDHWLPVAAQRGFFAFTWTKSDRWFIWPGMTRSVTNWFLASEPGGTIIACWEKEAFKYWEGRKSPHVYYWPHVLFELLELTNRAFRRSYESVPKIGCYGPHLVHDCVTRGRDPDLVVELLASGALPVQKLRWNWTTDRQELAMSLLRKAEDLSDNPD